MADAKKCDRCGKLFEPYVKLAGYKNPQEFVKLLVMHANLDNKQNPSENVYVDLCNECYESFSKWLAKPSVVNGNRSCFGEYGAKEYGCISCPTEQECEKATKQETEYKRCNMFGAFDGSVDCLMCPKCDECREVTNTIKEASSNGE